MRHAAFAVYVGIIAAGAAFAVYVWIIKPGQHRTSVDKIADEMLEVRCTCGWWTVTNGDSVDEATHDHLHVALGGPAREVGE